MGYKWTDPWDKWIDHGVGLFFQASLKSYSVAVGITNRIYSTASFESAQNTLDMLFGTDSKIWPQAYALTCTDPN